MLDLISQFWKYDVESEMEQALRLSTLIIDLLFRLDYIRNSWLHDVESKRRKTQKAYQHYDTL